MICSRDECDNEFTPTTHNNIFCSDECCKIATLEKARRTNQDKRDRLAGKIRMCSNGCGSVLSRYNETTICQMCKGKAASRDRQILLDMIGAGVDAR